MLFALIGEKEPILQGIPKNKYPLILSKNGVIDLIKFYWKLAENRKGWLTPIKIGDIGHWRVQCRDIGVDADCLQSGRTTKLESTRILWRWGYETFQDHPKVSYNPYSPTPLIRYIWLVRKTMYGRQFLFGLVNNVSLWS